ncbi:MBL fold metallo-hydrolase [Paenibacillus sp. JTLBN-2024]
MLTGEDPGRAVIIDPGMNPGALIKKIEPLTIEAILLTHAHFDHMGGVDEIRKLKNCPVYLHDLEADWLENPKLNGSLNWPQVSPPLSTRPCRIWLGRRAEAGVDRPHFHGVPYAGAFAGKRQLFVRGRPVFGDVLFKLGVGRTDLYGGRERDLLDSIQNKLFAFKDEVKVYPGHGPKTTIGYERAHNPYVS